MSALPAGADDYDPGHGWDEAFEAPGVVREHYVEVLESLAETGLERAAQGIEARLREQDVRFGGDEGTEFVVDPVPAPAHPRRVGGADARPASARPGPRRVRRRHARRAPRDRRRGHPRADRGGLGLPGARPAGHGARGRRARRHRRARRRARPRRALHGARGQRPHALGQRLRARRVGGGRGRGAGPPAPRGGRRVAARRAASLHGGDEPGRRGRARPAERRAGQLGLVRAPAARRGRGPAPRPAAGPAPPRPRGWSCATAAPSAPCTGARTRIACGATTAS